MTKSQKEQEKKNWPKVWKSSSQLAKNQYKAHSSIGREEKGERRNKQALGFS